jgi:ElaB/YqjD/DUF883 family membrane-anchored ribosome-binding protein
MAHSTIDMNKAREQAGQQFDSVVDGFENVAAAAMKRGSEMSHEVQDAVGSAKTAVDTSVRNHPMTTIAVTAALGFLLGAMWKR